MKLSLSTLGCPGWSWNEIFATAKDLGMNGIEVRGVANEMFAPAISVFNQGKRMETLERIEKVWHAAFYADLRRLLRRGGIRINICRRQKLILILQKL